MSISTHSGNFSPRHLKHHVSKTCLPVKSLNAPARDEDFFLGLWKRANLIRSFIWSHHAADEASLLRQVLARIQGTFGIDFCFAALHEDSGRLIQVGVPEALLDQLPPALVSRSMDLVANSRMAVKWNCPEAQTGFRTLVVAPLWPTEGRLLGFLLLAHSSRRIYTRAELVLTQALAGEVGWAIRELRFRRAQHKRLSAASLELRNALNLIRGDCRLWPDGDSSTPAAEQRRSVPGIETNIKETLRMIVSLLHASDATDARYAGPRESIDLVSAIETALAACRPQAMDAGVEFVAQFSADLPREFVTEPMRFYQVLRNLTEYAVEVSGHGRVLLSARRNPETIELTLQISDPRPDRQPDPRVARPGAKQQCGHVRHSSLEAVHENLEALNGRLHFVKRLGEGIEIGVRLGLE